MLLRKFITVINIISENHQDSSMSCNLLTISERIKGVAMRPPIKTKGPNELLTFVTKRATPMAIIKKIYR